MFPAMSYKLLQDLGRFILSSLLRFFLASLDLCDNKMLTYFTGFSSNFHRLWSEVGFGFSFSASCSDAWHLQSLKSSKFQFVICVIINFSRFFLASLTRSYKFPAKSYKILQDLARSYKICLIRLSKTSLAKSYKIL